MCALRKTFFAGILTYFKEKWHSAKRGTVRVRWQLEEYTLAELRRARRYGPNWHPFAAYCAKKMPPMPFRNASVLGKAHTP